MDGDLRSGAPPALAVADRLGRRWLPPGPAEEAREEDWSEEAEAAEEAAEDEDHSDSEDHSEEE